MYVLDSPLNWNNVINQIDGYLFTRRPPASDHVILLPPSRHIDEWKCDTGDAATAAARAHAAAALAACARLSFAPELEASDAGWAASCRHDMQHSASDERHATDVTKQAGTWDLKGPTSFLDC